MKTRVKTPFLALVEDLGYRLACCQFDLVHQSVMDPPHRRWMEGYGDGWTRAERSVVRSLLRDALRRCAHESWPLRQGRNYRAAVKAAREGLGFGLKVQRERLAKGEWPYGKLSVLVRAEETKEAA